ncbi:MAG: HIT family protein [Candidatus Hodarchaeota archaeon]
MACKLSDEEKNRVIYKDQQVQINLFLGDTPYALGHMVIELLKSEDDVSKLTDNHWKILSRWISKVSNAMKKVLKEVSAREVQKIYICSFNESPEYKVHFHVIPRYEGETLMGEELLFRRASAKLMVSPSDRNAIVCKMKREFGIKKSE